MNKSSCFGKEPMIASCAKDKRKVIISNEPQDVTEHLKDFIEFYKENIKDGVILVLTDGKDALELTYNELDLVEDINVMGLEEFTRKPATRVVLVADILSFSKYRYSHTIHKAVISCIFLCYNKTFSLSAKHCEHYFHYIKNIPISLVIGTKTLLNFPELLVDLMFCQYRDKISSTKMLKSKLEFKDYSYCSDKLVISNKSINTIIDDYNLYLHVVEPTEEQLKVNINSLFKTTRGVNAKPQMDKVLSIIRENKENTGVVYATNLDVMNKLNKLAKAEGVNSSILLDTDSNNVKDYEFVNLREGGLLITNIVDLSELYIDYLIYFNYSKNIDITLSKKSRKKFPNTLDIHFLFTNKTKEALVFYNQIYKYRSCKRLFGDKIEIVKNLI